VSVQTRDDGRVPASGAAPRIALVIQGPIYEQLNGHSTLEILEFLSASPLRRHFYVVYAAWDTEAPDRLDVLRPHLDQVSLARQPERWGSGNRNLQRHGIAAALDLIEPGGFEYVLKTRSDFGLTDRLLAALVERAERGYERVLVTNVFTRYEPFHISDMLVFSTFANVRAWYDTREVYYEDLYSPEVQFARMFVRSRQLPYPMTMLGHLEFLRDWIEVLDFGDCGLVWFKDLQISRSAFNRFNWIIYDRDSGPTLTRLIPAGYPERLRRTLIPLGVVATGLLLRDLLVRSTLVGGGALLERLGLGVKFTTVRLASGKQLRFKWGVATKRYAYYHVDPMGSEHDMPIGGHSRRPPPPAQLGEPVPEMRTVLRTPLLRVDLLQAAPPSGEE
jgi:hypothetical protein